LKRVAIILVVLVVILVGAAAGLYFFGPEDLKQTVGLVPIPTATPEGAKPPTPTPDPGVDIIVPSIDLKEGTYITDTDALLTTKNIPTSRFEEQAEDVFKSTQVGDIRNKVLNIDVLADTPIKKEYLVPPGLAQVVPTPAMNAPRPKAYPLEVDSFTGVSDQIREGDSVDVLVTFKVKRRVYLPSVPRELPTPRPPVITNDGTVIEDTVADQPPESLAGAGGLEERDFFTTKTIVQHAKVLNVLHPPTPTPQPVQDDNGDSKKDAPPPETAPAPATNNPEEEARPKSVRTGTWQVVIAVTDQQAELIEYAKHAEGQITLVLRGAGDNSHEETIGASFDLLFSEFGLPLPEPENPFVFAPEVLTPQPTRTPVSTLRIP
jgi:pilus assembly protein CpaB